MPTPTPLAPPDLAAIAAFADLPADTVAWLLAHGEGRRYAAAQPFSSPARPPNA